jgi:prephenate dehydrogenase
MKIGIVGLGLIGGSVAKSIRKNTLHQVYGIDRDVSIMAKAKMVGALDEELTSSSIGEMDLLLLAIYPNDTFPYLQEMAPKIKKEALVMDLCGVKEKICRDAFPLAQEMGFYFIGGHPMAGIEFSGFDASKESLFRNASMILVPPPRIPILKLEFLKTLFLSLGFSHIEISTPEKHDKIIALSSQLAHVVSSAYVQSPQAMQHKGYSAGSFHDMTRVAKLNEELWSQLFFSNYDNLLEEIDGLILRLSEYRNVIKQRDEEGLKRLLSLGRQRRVELE